MAEISDKPPKDSPDFVKKTVDTPILGASFRDSIRPAQPAPSMASGAGFKGFYQANKFYFIAIIAGAVIISVLAFLAFRKAPATAPKDANVDVSVDVPQTVASGGEAVYKITATNNDPQKLVGLELELAYPDGIAYESSSPNAENLSGTLFKVPDLISGQNAAIFVKTKVTGNINDQKILNIKLHYKYSNFNSEFVKSVSSTVQLVASDVTVELGGPSQANNAQLVVYTVKYKNNSQHDISNARIKLTYAPGFVYAQSTPQPDLGSDTWNIGTLAQGGSGEISVQGTFNSVSPGESKTAQADFLILNQTGEYFVQNTSAFTTNISSLPLLVSQSMTSDSSSGDVSTVDPGQTLHFNINYQNNGTTAASGVNIEVDLNSKVLDLSTLQAEGAQVNNSSIIWNASGAPQLENLAPNAQGQLSFSVRVNNPAVKDSSKNLTIISSIKIQSNEYDSPFPGNQLTLKISSPSSVNSALTFVSGQLPPKVGQATVYKVHLALTNSSNDFGSGLLTAFIPAGSFITGSVTPSENANVQFDTSTNKLTWNVGALPANTGRFGAPRALEFQVRLTPSASQQGQSPTLVSTINFNATDLFTQQAVSVKANDISTSDIQGSGGYGSGFVQ